MQNNDLILDLKIEIDTIKEYLSNEICKKCEQLSIRLKECEILLNEYSRLRRENNKD